ncbi:MAG: hypothetical protein NVS3B26_18750 [Mycobacteriales bacterium]
MQATDKNCAHRPGYLVAQHGEKSSLSTRMVDNVISHAVQVQISAKTDYALRALCVLAVAPEGAFTRAGEIAESQGIPQSFLEGILTELRRAGLVESRRGADGGHRLGRPAFGIVLADVVRVMDGPLALVHGERPENMIYPDPARHLQDVWVAVRAGLRLILESTTLEQVASGRLPQEVIGLCEPPRSWTSVWPPPAG